MEFQDVLLDLDINSFTFWDTLYQEFSVEVIHHTLFSSYKYQNKVLCQINSYLHDMASYAKARDSIEW